MTTTPCVSLTTGTLRPDERVNYAYGMVLGLDEFLTEQLYLLSKDWLHERALHGFGTVSGLAVSVSQVDTRLPGHGQHRHRGSTSGAARSSSPATSAPGSAPGSPRRSSRARGPSPSTSTPPGRPPSTSSRRTPSASTTWCRCPGQPCTSSDQTMVRQPDPRRLGRRAPLGLTRRCRAGTPTGGWPGCSATSWSSTDCRRPSPTRRRSSPPCSTSRTAVHDGPGSLDPPPATDLAAARRRRGRRPRPHPDRLGDAGAAGDRARPRRHPRPTSEPAILLATITFTPASPFDPAAPTIASCQDPDPTGRPVPAAHRADPGGAHDRRRGRAALRPPRLRRCSSSRWPAPALPAVVTIEAWFHLAQPVRLPAAVDVTDETGTTTAYAAVADVTRRQRVLEPVAADLSRRTGGPAPEGQVVVRFPAATVLVGDPATSLLQIESSHLASSTRRPAATCSRTPRSQPPRPPRFRMSSSSRSSPS